MTNWKRLYTDASKMLAMYQDEIVPGLREQLENRAEVVRADTKRKILEAMGESLTCANGLEKAVIEEMMKVVENA